MNINIIIRSANKDDAGLLADLAARTFADAYGEILPPADLQAYLQEAFSLEQVLRDIANPDVVILVAVTSGEICGYTKWEPTPLPKSLNATNSIELMRLYLLGKWQGQGVGAELLTAGLTAVKARGYQMCWLKVWEGNDKAISFYQRKGFKQSGNTSYQVSNICRNVVLMTRTL